MRLSSIVTLSAATVTVPVISRPLSTAPLVLTVREPDGVSVVPGGTPVLVASG